MTGFHLADLSRPPSRILVGNGNLTEEKREWVQPATYWSLIYYCHTNAVTQQNQTTRVGEGDVVVFAPGVRASHAKVGEDTWFEYFTFDLPGQSHSLEAIARFMPAQEHIWSDLRRASARITDTAMPAIAFVWNYLWSISGPRSKHRSNDAIYVAEAFIRNNLDNKMAVTQIAEMCKMTSRHLLRLFREEHNCSIQDYIRGMRVQEATRLLLETELPIKQVALRVGVADLQEFNKLIRSATGASPTAYREKR